MIRLQKDSCLRSEYLSYVNTILALSILAYLFCCTLFVACAQSPPNHAIGQPTKCLAICNEVSYKRALAYSRINDPSCMVISCGENEPWMFYYLAISINPSRPLQPYNYAGSGMKIIRSDGEVISPEVILFLKSAIEASNKQKPLPYEEDISEIIKLDPCNKKEIKDCLQAILKRVNFSKGYKSEEKAILRLVCGELYTILVRDDSEAKHLFKQVLLSNKTINERLTWAALYQLLKNTRLESRCSLLKQYEHVFHDEKIKNECQKIIAINCKN